MVWKGNDGLDGESFMGFWVVVVRGESEGFLIFCFFVVFWKNDFKEVVVFLVVVIFGLFFWILVFELVIGIFGIEFGLLFKKLVMFV